MGFDDEIVASNLDVSLKDGEAATSGSFGNGKGVKQQGQDVHNVPFNFFFFMFWSLLVKGKDLNA